VDVGIVDADESVQRSLARLLRSAGYSTRAYSSTAEYLAAATVLSIQCLILDVGAPGASGLEFFAQLASTKSEESVIVMAAGDSPDQRQSALDAGAVSYLEKPVAEDVLLAAIRTALCHGEHNGDNTDAKSV
jgi:FixJ family two-component response regulator